MVALDGHRTQDAWAIADAHRRNRRAVEDAEATRSSVAATTEVQVPAVAHVHRLNRRAVRGAVATRSSAEAAVIAGQVAAEEADATRLVVTDRVDVRQRRTVPAVRRAAVRCLVAVVADAARALALPAAAAVAERAPAVVDAAAVVVDDRRRHDEYISN